MNEPVARASHRVEIAGSEEWFEVPDGERILTAARAAGHWLPFECGWGKRGTCKATVVEGETRLLFPEAPAVNARDERRRRVVLCQSTPVTDLVIKPLRVDPAAPPERQTVDTVGRLVHVEALSADVSSFRFDTAEPVVFRPGQYAILDLAPGLRRCYSMANLPGGHELEFIAKRYPGGIGSTTLFDLPVGVEIGLEAPYGDMWLRPTTRPVLFVAGGTGISPILSMVRHVASLGGLPTGADAGTPRLEVVYGATGVDDLVRWEELSTLVDQIPGAALLPTLLTPPPGWQGVEGLVTDALTSRLADLGDVDVYVAGPPRMVDTVTDVTKASGVQLDRLFFDRFG